MKYFQGLCRQYRAYYNYSFHKHNCIIPLFIATLIALLWGCSAISVIPTGLKEIKEIIAGKEWAVNKDILTVEKAMIVTMKRAGFTIEKVFCMGGTGGIDGRSNDMLIHTEFEAVSPKMTRLTVKARREGSIIQDNAVSKGLLKGLEEVLWDESWRNYAPILKGMNEIFYEKAKDADILGYIRPGVPFDLIGQEGNWTQIELFKGVRGYILTKKVRPLAEPQ